MRTAPETGVDERLRKKRLFPFIRAVSASGMNMEAPMRVGKAMGTILLPTVERTGLSRSFISRRGTPRATPPPGSASSP